MPPQNPIDSPAHDWVRFYTDLFERYYPIMKKQALSVLHESALADDAIQNALLRLMGKYKTLQSLHEAQLVFYLVKTVRNCALEYLRQQKVELNRSCYSDIHEAEVLIPDLDTPERTCERYETRDELAAAVRQLPKDFQDLLIFKYMLGNTNLELASLYQTSLDNIRQRLSRARRKLLQLMGGVPHE